jgi:shikimate kinase
VLSQVNNLLQGISVFLIGMMGSGKTTVGRLLAQQLDYHFFDTDVLIEQIAGKTINEIFADSGEDSFRQLEAQVLSELSARKNLAIATGGGIVLQRMNWSYLHHGLVVWLDAPVDVLLARLENDTTRPLLQNPNPAQVLQRLLDERRSLYAEADLRIHINASDTPEAIALRVIAQIPTVLKPPRQAHSVPDNEG